MSQRGALAGLPEMAITFSDCGVLAKDAALFQAGETMMLLMKWQSSTAYHGLHTLICET